MDDYILALDMGTTSTKGVLYQGRSVVAGAVRSYPSLFPGPRMVEQNQDQVLEAAVEVSRELMDRSGVPASRVAAVSFSGILHSLLLVQGDGNAAGNALLWADLRASEQSNRLRKEMDPDRIRERTGCTIHPLYYPSRVLWFQENAPSLLNGSRLVSIKEYVVYRLFGTFAADRSVASGTGLLNNRTLDWDTELLSYLNLKPEQFSPLVEPTARTGGLLKSFAPSMGLLQGTPCVVGGADGPLAHLGSAGINTDLLSLTIGTSAALRRWTPEPANTPGRESWCYYLSEGNWVIGGVVHDAGNVMQWLRDIIGPADENTFFSLVEEAASVPPGAEGLCFLPYFSGERSPRYNPFARAALTGMGFAHTRVHLIRALMEGIAFRVEEVYSMIDPERTARLVVSGGIRNSPAWLRVTADFLGRELHFPVSRESTAWGAALMAMRSLGTLPDLAAAGDLVETEGGVDFNPAVHARYGAVRSLYHEQYKRLFD